MRTRARSLARWLALSFGVFVVVASLGLVVVFQQIGMEHEEEAFVALTNSNADFLRRSTLPRSPEMERRLGAVMDAKVSFAQIGSEAPYEVARRSPDGRIEVAHRLDEKHDVVFSRPSTGLLGLVNHRRTWLALGVLWFSSLGLGAWLARGLTRPLQQMTQAVPSLGGHERLPTLPVERSDELGLLARSMEHTHATLLEEKEKRRSAERLALLGRMAASLAHEVRNPVSAIRLHAQLLDGAPAAEADASRRLIETEAERIEALVTQWMSYARPLPPVIRSVEVEPMLKRAIEQTTPQAAHAGVELKLRSVVKAVLQADAERLHQVLLNVLLNAIQAMRHPGQVIVESRIEEGKCIITIEDEGPGFSTAALDHAREPFFTEKEGGMGLGLAVSDELLRAHGGELRLENTSQGARVSLILPLDSASTS